MHTWAEGWGRAEVWESEVVPDLPPSPAVFAQSVSPAEMVTRRTRPLLDSSSLPFLPSCLENNPSFLKHTMAKLCPGGSSCTGISTPKAQLRARLVLPALMDP